MVRQRFTVFSSLKRGEFFFSTDHCQRFKGTKIDRDFVPISYEIPQWVVPREGVPHGWIENRKQLLIVYHSKQREIPNPDPAFQPRKA